MTFKRRGSEIYKKGYGIMMLMEGKWEGKEVGEED